jgi:hypothetical protein
VAVVEHSVDDSSTCSRAPGACDFWIVEFTAAAGERNRIVLSGGHDGITIRDRGAEIEAGAHCAASGPHEVRCVAPKEISHAVVAAGDQGDVVESIMPLHARIAGGAGNDLLVGGADVEKLYAGPGRDRLFGGRGNDFLYDGRDGGAVEPDVMDGGYGHDFLSYERRTRRVQVNLSDPGFASGQAGEGDRLRGIDVVYAGRGNDVLIGSARDDHMSGGPGNDRMRGGAGDDDLYGDGGADKLFGGNGADTLEAGRGDDAVVGGCGRDGVYGAEGDDRLYAADGERDEILGDLGMDIAWVDAGRDRVGQVERLRRGASSTRCAP